MFKIAVCDDEILQRLDIVNKLKSALENIDFVFQVEEFTNGEELLSCKSYFDIIFLDIKMHKLSGIDVARKLRKNKNNSKIIFITSFKEYVFQAFDVSAFHYLMKPISKEKILKIINKVLKSFSEEKNDDLYIVITKSRRAIKVLLNNIYFFEMQNRIVIIHTINGTIEYYDKISNIEEKIPSSDFFRCHRSYIVNLKYVMKFDKSTITLDNNEKILLSQSRYDDFSKAFLIYLKKCQV
ncbi:LytTR family DNA-binding domain-containing protein [Clostridium sp. JS66]|uniref:LytR/AlgR family response regulator transcription factor n=1 Tax=Clostridium sp. JS66 TaxID=3064705 RepID=UPI00298D8BB5|nr:LytTR family DNA-binding domain-containing protein [Clostridium sp. JS66]WPC39437.1 LytTR family DNA-binding domain-containing protein [Clostridium sp. JS66]